MAKIGVEESKDLIGPQGFELFMISIGLVVLSLATLQNRSAIQALAAKYPAKEAMQSFPDLRHSNVLENLSFPKDTHQALKINAERMLCARF